MNKTHTRIVEPSKITVIDPSFLSAENHLLQIFDAQNFLQAKQSLFNITVSQKQPMTSLFELDDSTNLQFEEFSSWSANLEFASLQQIYSFFEDNVPSISQVANGTYQGNVSDTGQDFLIDSFTSMPFYTINNIDEKHAYTNPLPAEGLQSISFKKFLTIDPKSIRNYSSKDIPRTYASLIKTEKFALRNYSENHVGKILDTASKTDDVFSEVFDTDITNSFTKNLPIRPEFTDNVTTINPAPIMNRFSLGMSITDLIDVHTGTYANRLTHLFNADAITLGNEIFFAESKFDLINPKGIALLVHELTHINQMQNNPQISNTKSYDRQIIEQNALENEKQTLTYFLNNQTEERSTYNNISSETMLNYDLITNYPLTIDPMVTAMTPTNLFDIAFLDTTHSETTYDLTNRLSIFGPFQHDDKKPETGFSNTWGMNLLYLSSQTIQSTEKPSQIPTAAKQNYSSFLMPLTAQSDRSSTPNSSASRSSPTSITSQVVDIESITNRVYDRLTQKIKLERDRTGYR